MTTHYIEILINHRNISSFNFFSLLYPAFIIVYFTDTKYIFADHHFFLIWIFYRKLRGLRQPSFRISSKETQSSKTVRKMSSSRVETVAKSKTTNAYLEKTLRNQKTCKRKSTHPMMTMKANLKTRNKR